jgi:hypothetical protein
MYAYNTTASLIFFLQEMNAGRVDSYLVKCRRGNFLFYATPGFERIARIVEM